MSREILIPEYLTKFSCIGASCEDTCCAGWKVTVDKTTFQKYRNISKPGIKEELKKYITRERSNPSESSYGKIKMTEKNVCTMLTEDGWCKIQSELGEEFLCNTCSVYPRTLKEVDNRLEKSLTPSCPEAARLILLNETGIDFIIDEEQIKKNILVEARLHSNDKKYFWELRMFTIEMLQNRKQSLDVRLIVIGMFFQKISEIPIMDWALQLEPIMTRYKNILIDDEQIQLLLNLPENLSFQMNVAKELLNYRLMGGISSQRYLDCVNDMINSLQLNDETDINDSVLLYKRFYAEYYVPFMREHEYILENYAVNYVFKNLFPYDQPNLFESFVMLSVNISIIKLHLIGMAGHHKGLTTELVIKLIQSYAKTIEHNVSYLQNVREMLNESGYSTMAHMIVLLKS
ncbi:flagellin lysine-N-methylase [Lysinibacillus sphaericus]|uniref:flagellin lysine-N-methylase n=1 Tax=Lysinibacillus sphaericus TaxID=1421 RepID=UPI0037FDE004